MGKTGFKKKQMIKKSQELQFIYMQYDGVQKLLFI